MVYLTVMMPAKCTKFDLNPKKKFKSLSTGYNTIAKLILALASITDLLEWVVILDNQKVLINESVASLMERAYAVTGKSSDVEAYIENRHTLGLEYLGNYCKAILLEQPTEDTLLIMNQMGLEKTKVGLQELFIKLTDIGGVLHEIPKVG